MTNKEIERLVQEAERRYDYPAHLLEEAVLEEAQLMASAVNGDGLQSQVEFLLTRGWSLAEVEKLVGNPSK